MRQGVFTVVLLALMIPAGGHAQTAADGREASGENSHPGTAVSVLDSASAGPSLAVPRIHSGEPAAALFAPVREPAEPILMLPPPRRLSDGTALGLTLVTLSAAIIGVVLLLRSLGGGDA